MALPRERSAFLDFNEPELSDAELRRMYWEMVEWLAEQQVRDASHPHYGAIYFPTETRYDNRDTGLAGLAFWRCHAASGDAAFAEQALLARDYALRVQEEDGGYAELTRNNERMDEGSLVNTGMIADGLIRAYRAGLPHGDADHDALARMADFILTLEWQPGGFYHDEGHLSKNTRLDCQNTTCLAAVALSQISDFLEAQGIVPKAEWLEAARRTIPRIVDGQEATGQWPYRKDMLDAFPCDMNHHGMVMVHVGDIYERFGDPALLDVLIRGGEWLVEDALLHTERGTKHNWTHQRSACLYFSWGYFMTSSALAKLAHLDASRAEHWAHEAREIMRYVRSDLWHNPRLARLTEGTNECIPYTEKGPVKLTEGGWAPGYAWHGQSMGWSCYQMDHLLSDLGIGFGAK